MSLIFLEGWDNIATADMAAKGWLIQQLNGAHSIQSTTARTGQALTMTLASNNNNKRFYKMFGTAQEHATITVGLALFRVSALLGEVMVLASDGAAARHITLRANADGSLAVLRGVVTLGTTAPGAVSIGGWNFVELQVTMSDTVGVVTVRVNNVIVLNLTGQDTKNGGSKVVFDSVILAMANLEDSNNTSGQTHHYDDIYVVNGAGTTNNGFLGDLRVRTIAPNANGTSSQLVGSDTNSVDNYLLVDEATPAVVDFVGSSVLDAKDTYNFADLPDTSGNVLGVQINALATKTDSATRNLALVTRSAAADYDGPDNVLALGSNSLVQHLREIDPATGAAWTRAAVNAAEFGVKVR